MIAILIGAAILTLVLLFWLLHGELNILRCRLRLLEIANKCSDDIILEMADTLHETINTIKVLSDVLGSMNQKEDDGK